MTTRRPPWWMFLVLVPCASYVLLTWYLHAFGPETPGFVYFPSSWQVVAVQSGLAADRAGIRVGDRVVSVNGKADRAGAAELALISVGKQYELVLARDGQRRSVSWTTGRNTRAFWRDREGITTLALVPEAIFCTFLAWFIAFRRPDHATARLGAILFALLPAGTSIADLPAGWPAAILSLPRVLAFLPVFAVILVDVAGPLMVMFYAEFPRPVIRGRWIWAAISVPAVFQLVASVARLGGTLQLWVPPVEVVRYLLIPARIIGAGYLVAAAGALLWNYRNLRDASDRRRIRLFVAGFFVGLLPVPFEVGVRIAAAYGSRGARSLLLASWLSPWTVFATLLVLTGEAMEAYAILRHRLLDVSIMVRQGLQYATARGVLLGLAPLFGLMLVGDLAWHSDQSMAQAFVARGWLYAALGAAALLAHRRRDTWLSALDRRFFRERYDAQRILSDVLSDVRAARSFAEVVPGVVDRIEKALHPRCVAVAVRDPHDATFRTTASAGEPPPAIPAESKLIALVRVLGKPLELPQSDSVWLRRQLPPEETEWLTASRLEWVFPIVLGAERSEALLVLGPKRSEEPYTRDDQALIEGIASGLALLHERLATSASATSGPTVGAFVVAPVATRYVIRRELGRGGMGTVYEAKDTELERGVAIKVMRPDLVASPEAVTRFKREARAAASFSHPNVVTVYDVGVADDGRAYLVMELLAGETIRQALRREKRFAPDRTLAIMRGVCAAVDGAHRRRLLHRDLKPENVFLATTAEGQVPKILDFGVAKLLDAGEETALQGDTTPGQLLGTLAYMSPEQLRGEPPSPAFDLWALGVMAYEMLTGRHPFAPSARHIAEPDESRILPTEVHALDGADAADAFFATALSRDIAERPATAREWLERFDAMLVVATVAPSPLPTQPLAR